MSNWVDAFQTVKPISSTDRFNIYKAKNQEGIYFVKEIGKDANVWNRTSIKKEYEIYSTIDLQHYMTPDVYKYEDSTILSVEWIDIQPWDNISDNSQVHNLIDDLVLLLTDIQNQDFSSVETR